jgi:hypothetical protein
MQPVVGTRPGVLKLEMYELGRRLGGFLGF